MITIIEDTAGSIGCTNKEVFILACDEYYDGSQEVTDRAYNIWLHNRCYPEWVEHYCLEILRKQTV